MGDRHRRRRDQLDFVIFAAGSADRVDVLFGLDYAAQIEVYRVLVWVVPPVVVVATLRICRELQEGERVSGIRAEAK